jgi:hypothetical protein
MSNKVSLHEAIGKGPDRVFRDFDVTNWHRSQTSVAGTSGVAGSASNDKWSGYDPSKYQACQHKGTKVFTLRAGLAGAASVEFWAVQQHHVRGLALNEGLDCWISLNGSQPSLAPFVSRAGSRGLQGTWEAFLTRLEMTEHGMPVVIALDWPDHGVPAVMDLEQFWPTLIQGLLGQAEAKLQAGQTGPLKVALSCIGSHGRTGTALAAILATAGMSADLAITTVRELHCKKMLETKGQEAYIGLVAEHSQKVAVKTILHYQPVADQAGKTAKGV